MTSKISFNKLLKEDFRHRLWVPALACVVFFLSIIGVAMSLQNLEGTENVYENYVLPVISGENYWIVFVTVIGATICGLESFSYLFQKQKVDFYHSLPIRREKLFMIRYLNGLLFYAVPSFIYSIAILGVTGAAGFGGQMAVKEIFLAYVQNLLIFLMFYHTAVMASMLCGTLLVAGVLYAILVGYGVAIAELIPSFVTNFFSSYYTFSGGFLKWINYISPFYLMSLIMDEGVFAYLYAVLFSAVIFFAAFRMYRIRPSEAAGKSLTFKKTRSVFRILIIVPSALYVGIFFHDMASGFQSAWTFAGIVIFLILLHGITEVIYDFDLRSAMHHKKQLAACILFCLAFGIFFVTDPLGIDSKVPDQASVKKVYLDPSNLYLTSCYDLENDIFTDDSAYRLDHCVLENEELSKFYDLMQYAVSPNAIDENNDTLYSDATWDQITVRFVKNNGTCENRKFYINATGKQAMDEIYACEDYRHSLYQIFDETYVDAINNAVSYAGGNDNEFYDSTVYAEFSDKAEIQQLIAAYRKDLDSLSYEEIIDSDVTKTAFTIEFTLAGKDSTLQYPVYNEFTNTIALLKGMKA